ncbi:MAG TPA: hypothetical protein VFX37_15080 [Pseudolabrys sp.]|nr:hypothetical protein [Pseudolabrys sp.]
MTLADQIDAVESGGDPTATNTNSSAMGVSQFIAPTWLSVIKQHFPQVAQGKSDADILAMRADPNLSQEATAAYAADNRAFLAKNGLPVTPGSVYLAHFAGPQGAADVLKADPATPVSDILGPQAVKANPFLQGMTAQGLRAWAASKMGTTVPHPGAQNNAPASPGTPTNLLPPQPATPAAKPIFANSIPALAARAAAMRAMAPPQAQPPLLPQAQPIFAPPPPQIDLSGLRAALAQRLPIFANRG